MNPSNTSMSSSQRIPVAGTEPQGGGNVPNPRPSMTSTVPPRASSSSTSMKDGKQIKKGQTKGIDPSKIRKNDHGGILITPDEIIAAFRYLDVQGKGYVGLHNLRKRLNIFHKSSMPLVQYKSLLGDKNELTLKDLNELLLDNTCENYDPVAEAFKVYDAKETGYMSTDLLKEIFNDLELLQLTDDDLAVLIKAADADGDGLIGLEDFRLLAEAGRGPPLPRHPPSSPSSAVGKAAQSQQQQQQGGGGGGGGGGNKQQQKIESVGRKGNNGRIGHTSLKRTMKGQKLSSPTAS